MCNFVKGYGSQKTSRDSQVRLYVSAGSNERHVTCQKIETVRFEAKK